MTAEKIKIEKENPPAKTETALNRLENVYFQIKEEAKKLIEEQAVEFKGKNPDEIREALNNNPEKLKEIISEIWDFAVHGKMRVVNWKTGEKKLFPIPDLDGETVINLFKLAGIKTNFRFVKPESRWGGGVTYDSGNVSEFKTQKEKRGVAIVRDHHGEQSTIKSLPACRLAYLDLISLGLLEKNYALDNLTRFISKDDRGIFPKDIYNKTSGGHKTIWALKDKIGFETLLQYFKDNPPLEKKYNLTKEELEKYREYRKNPEKFKLNEEEKERYKKFSNYEWKYKNLETRILSEDEIRKYGLSKIAGKKRESIDKSRVGFKKLEKEGCFLETKFGKLLLAVGDFFPGGILAAYGLGADGYLYFNPQSGGFFLTFPKQDMSELKIPLGKNQRNSMWVYDPLVEKEKDTPKFSVKEILKLLEAKVKENSDLDRNLKKLA